MFPAGEWDGAEKRVELALEEVTKHPSEASVGLCLSSRRKSQPVSDDCDYTVEASTAGGDTASPGLVSAWFSLSENMEMVLLLKGENR